MSIDVRSEVGRLRRVLVHEPGLEVDRMVPSMMEELLFDDILFGEAGRAEHRRFCEVLRHLGAEPVQAKDLLIEALADDAARALWVATLGGDLSGAARERMGAADASELADILVHGIRHQPGASGLGAGELFELTPIANWCFQRDPQVIVGDGVVFCPMATATRWREALLSRCIFQFHPELKSTPVILDPLTAPAGQPVYMGISRPSFEGGDIMVLSPEVIAVGASERSNRPGVRQLARSLAGREGGPRWLIVVDLPHRRAYMHLDTVMTPIDRHQALVFPPVILPGHNLSAGTYVMDLQARDPQFRSGGDVLSTMAAHGIDLSPIPCGGQDQLNQEREQWTDGANALCVAPGIVVLYDRNVGTAESLAQAGYEVIHADEILAGTRRVDPENHGPTCILITSNEVSRARGGPHCLTHALQRDPLE